MSDEERKSEKKKKKKHHKSGKKQTTSAAASSNNNNNDDDDGYEDKIRAKNDADYETSNEKANKKRSRAEKKKRDDDDFNNSSNNNNNASRRAMMERQKSEKNKLDQEGDDQFTSDAEVYCPTATADTAVMDEINQDGAVQVDDSGGIQAFVAETLEIDMDDVGIIKSDAEVEMEEKKRYSKLFLGAVAAAILGVIVIVVPLTLKFARGGTAFRLNIVTEMPTDAPSSMPSSEPTSMPSSIRFQEITEKLYSLSGDALHEQGSPQYRAAMWMADDDPLNLELSDAGFEQRYVLALFYFAMDGPNWTENNGWLSELSECFW